MRKILLAIALAAFACESPKAANPGSTVPRNDSLKLEIERAIDKGVEWLVKNQQEGGHWSTADHPALTALSLVALKGDPFTTAEARRVVEHGYDFLVS